MSNLIFRTMTAADLPQVLNIQHTCYAPAFHEPLEAFASKREAAPDTCWVAATPRGELQAYLVSLPIDPSHYPALHATHWSAPRQASELYLHDMAILPTLRGQGAGHTLLGLALGHARQHKMSQLSLIAVQASETYWCTHGFASALPGNPDMAHKLHSFGSDARLMVRHLDGRAALAPPQHAPTTQNGDSREYPATD